MNDTYNRCVFVAVPEVIHVDDDDKVMQEGEAVDPPSSKGGEEA